MGYTLKTTDVPNPDLEKILNLPIDPYSPYYKPGVGEEVTGLPVGMKMGDPYTGGATGKMVGPETKTVAEDTEQPDLGGLIMKELRESSGQGKVPLGSMPHAGKFPEQRAESPYVDITGLAKARAAQWERIGRAAREKAKAAETKRRELMKTLKESEE